MNYQDHLQQNTGISKRNPVIDVTRGIAMILVVGGHSWLPFWFDSELVGLFHMSLFMTISGYCFSERHFQDGAAVRQYILHKVTTLYLPYAFGNAVFVLLNNVFLRFHIYCGNSELADAIQVGIGMDPYLPPREMLRQVLLCFLFIGFSPRMGGATWFLRALFFISILYALVGFCIRRAAADHIGGQKRDNKKKAAGNRRIKWEPMDLQMVTAFLLLILWSVDRIHPFLPFGSIAQIFQYYFAYALGNFCRRHDLMKISSVLCGVLAVSCYCVLQLCRLWNTAMTSRMNMDQTAGSLLLLNVMLVLFQAVTGILGWIMIFGVSSLVCRFIPALEKLLICCGQGTLETLLLHFLCFKVVTEIYILVYHLPQFYLGATPVLPDINAFWGCLYILSGVGIPTGIHFIRMKWKNSCRMTRQRR